MRSLDATAGLIGRLLSAGDIFGASAPRHSPAPLLLADSTGPSKRVSFRTRASATRSQPAPLAAGSGRALSDYLQLPAEQYSLLDPSWVSRTGPATFRVALPLGSILSELLGGTSPPPALAVLVPAMTVTTAAAEGGVVLSGSDASLGTAAADEAFSLAFTLRLVWQPPRWGARGALRAEAGAEGWVEVPPPLARLPGPLLRTAGGLLAAAVAQALLPRFVQVLSDDYAAWAAGGARPEAAGSLLPTASAAPAKMLVGATVSDGAAAGDVDA